MGGRHSCVHNACVCIVRVRQSVCIFVYRMLQNLTRGAENRNSLILRELSRLPKKELFYIASYREGEGRRDAVVRARA